MLLYSLISGAVTNGACALLAHRSLSPAQMCLPRCAQCVLISEGLMYIRTRRLQPRFSMMGTAVLGAASEAGQVLGLSC